MADWQLALLASALAAVLLIAGLGRVGRTGRHRGMRLLLGTGAAGAGAALMLYSLRELT